MSEPVLAQMLEVKEYSAIRKFTLVRVHDGDTVIVDVPSWPVIFRPFPFRLFGYDAPELLDPRADIHELALRARDRLAVLLSGAFSIHPRCLDKYPRIDAEFTVKGVDVASVMLSEGLVKAYKGEGPKPW